MLEFAIALQVQASGNMALELKNCDKLLPVTTVVGCMDTTYHEYDPTATLENQALCLNAWTSETTSSNPTRRV